MGYKKPITVSEKYLTNAPLPTHGDTYTVVEHKEVIDRTKQMLYASGFKIEKEEYKANLDAKVAQGVYHIKPLSSTDEMIRDEEELGMMFAWTNSYDKSTTFKCAIGAYVFVCSNGVVSGDMMNFKRKHSGSANFDIGMQIAAQIKNAEAHYKRIIKDRNALKSVDLDHKQQCELLGRLYASEEILDTTQLSTVKAEMKKPSYDYTFDSDNAWSFYNHVTHALKKSHPRKWLSSQQNFHDFMVADLLSQNKIVTSEMQEGNVNNIVEMPDNQMVMVFE